MTRKIIHSDNAPAAIGTYSQAVKVDNTVYISGQIPLVPATGALHEGTLEEQIGQVFDNLKAICEAAGASINDAVKFNVYLTDLSNFEVVNAVMRDYLEAPYPARAAVEVSALPKGVQVEVDAIVVL